MNKFKNLTVSGTMLSEIEKEVLKSFKKVNGYSNGYITYLKGYVNNGEFDFSNLKISSPSIQNLTGIEKRKVEEELAANIQTIMKSYNFKGDVVFKVNQLEHGGAETLMSLRTIGSEISLFDL